MSTIDLRSYKPFQFTIRRGHFVAPALALMCWLSSLPILVPRQMSDLGFISVMDPLMFFSLFLIIISFCLHLQKANELVLAIHLFCLIFMLYHAMSMVGEAPRFSTTWTHIGITENLTRRGFNDVLLDARLSWPGFFAASGMLNMLAGFELSLSYVTFASLFFNITYAGILYVIYTSVTRNRQHVWFALLLYCLNNWVGQDYFAPQALNYLFYLTILAILLHWFKASTIKDFSPFIQGITQPVKKLDNFIASLDSKPLGRAWDVLSTNIYNDSHVDRSSTELQRIILVSVLAVLLAAIVGSHQLTPIVITVVVTSLVVFRVTYLYGISILSAVLTISWALFLGSAFLDGRLAGLANDVGNVEASLNENVIERAAVQVSASRQLVLNLRIANTLVVWTLAGIGAVRLALRKQLTLSMLVIAGSPLLILALQSYGGEGLLRIYFFMLPATAFLIAGTLYPSLKVIAHKISLSAAIALSLVFMSMFLFTRYGNEKMDFMSFEDLSGMQYLYSIAGEEALFVTYTWNGPLRFRDFEKHDFVYFHQDYPNVTAERIAATMQISDAPRAFLFVSNASRNFGELFMGLQKGWQEQLLNEVDNSEYFSLVYSNGDFIIYELNSDIPDLSDIETLQ